VRQHLRDIWKAGIGVLGLVLSLLAFTVDELRGLLLAIGALLAVWLCVELLISPNWPRNRRGRDALLGGLGAGAAAFLVLGLTWNTLSAASPDSGGEPVAVTRGAANQVFYELLVNGSILKEVGSGKTSALDGFIALKREAFAREGHVLAAALPFQDYQMIQDFYEYAAYPYSWVLGPDAPRHIDQLRNTVEEAQQAVFPYIRVSPE
jgi:hypothetical protein